MSEEQPDRGRSEVTSNDPPRPWPEPWRETTEGKDKSWGVNACVCVCVCDVCLWFISAIYSRTARSLQGARHGRRNRREITPHAGLAQPEADWRGGTAMRCGLSSKKLPQHDQKLRGVRGLSESTLRIWCLEFCT